MGKRTSWMRRIRRRVMIEGMDVKEEKDDGNDDERGEG